ncbi:MAG: ATP-binding protein [Wenzhouxiangellaceae bacterium]|nr:ATP-binding protein [Wenzhouxiangellaceae bacterium]
METLDLEFAVDRARAGFRLHRVEVYNWGTFNRQVWTLAPGGDNGLLTGDIGSGKSTLVDAITTLLVPAQKITYNKAAGAEARERSLRSYVLGYYKSERGESGLSARPVALRDINSYSVILGHFYNAGYDRHVTLAQVFSIRDHQGQPDRFYICADIELAIAEHFADFGSDLKNLRKRLRETAHVELFDSFPPYGAALRRRLGIASDQALELFNQTVSMKSVGNLTDFVRDHMLEAFPVEDRIQALIRHFDDLSRAHAAVLKAKAQIEQLEPIVSDADQHAQRSQQVERWRDCRHALAPWFAGLKAGLLSKRLESLTAELDKLAARIERLDRDRRAQQVARDDLRQAIAANGGDRLERIKVEIEQLETRKQACQHEAERYRRLAKAIELPVAEDAERFADNRAALGQLRETAEHHQAETQNRLTDLEVELRELRARHQTVDAEISSLKQRRNNLPAQMLAIRDQLLQTLKLPEDELPFAGELIRVRDEARDWEGAIERLLHAFALSLLVPDAHYTAVARWVDTTNLRGRLIYYRVRGQVAAPRHDLEADSLVRKLAIKPDCGVYGWLEAELGRRFDYLCCDDLERFRREKYAITRAGQIKSGRGRHEKDDRHAIDDRTRYVLGWSNRDKIQALEAQREALEKRIAAHAARIAELQQALSAGARQLENISRLDMLERFEQIDWQTPARAIAQLQDEYRRLNEQSDVLATLQQQLAAVNTRIGEIETELIQARDDAASARTRQEQARQQLDDCERAQREAEVAPATDAQLEQWRAEALGDALVNLNTIDARERDYRGWLQARIDNEDKQIRTLSQRIVQRMSAYCAAWPQETREVDASVESADEFRQMLARLKADELPSFEQRFKQLLNQNTIREVTTFQAQLNRERNQIGERIDTINRSLHEIDYQDNRYIKLVAERAPDAEIREFQSQLRACTEGSTTGTEDEQYSEQKFLQVKQIIERFRGREGYSEIDRRWTRKVTDVRNWFVFSASERWREDDSEHEHYTDSGGKSGGQKEKLAYTVLAASLAYQFGLEWGETRSRSFRFVVIDEAFGRGSDESARYGLELFRRLNLQLLIVTPLQKIHIIEPYVAAVGFVHNPDGRESMLRNLTIEELRAEREARARVQSLTG